MIIASSPSQGEPKLIPIQPGNLYAVNTSLLCESCGYDLNESEAASKPAALCPECGKPVSESLPTARKGSPWQQSPGLFKWAKTIRHTLFYPTKTFNEVSMHKTPRDLLILNILIASALIVAPFTGVFIGDWARSSRGQGPLLENLAYLSAFLAQALAVAGLLYAVTLFDIYGLQLYSKTRGWRLTSRSAWVVCSHASIGWLLAGVLPLLFMANFYIVGTLLKVDFTGLVFSSPNYPQITWQNLLGIGLPLIGWLGGLVAFELLAIKGAKTCKYANLPQANPAPLPA